MNASLKWVIQSCRVTANSQQSRTVHTVTRIQSTSSPRGGQQYKGEMFRSTSEVTTSWDKRLRFIRNIRNTDESVEKLKGVRKMLVSITSRAGHVEIFTAWCAYIRSLYIKGLERREWWYFSYWTLIFTQPCAQALIDNRLLSSTWKDNPEL